MQDNNKKIFFLSAAGFKKLFYPLISFVLVLITILVFFFFARFVISSIDKVFYNPSEAEIASQMVYFDKANYLIVAKKLGISVVEKQTSPVPKIVPNAENQPTTTSSVTIDKKSIKIAIYNSTQTPGVAAQLKAVLLGVGFDIAETGNKSPTQEKTTIKIKEGLLGSPLVEEIKTLVSSKYQIISETSNATSNFDVEIIIGKK